MATTHSYPSSLTTTVPRLLLLLALVIGTGIAQATPVHYRFDLGSAGAGEFTIKYNASASVVDVTELSAFRWNVSGVGVFDLADLKTFSFSNWSPLLGAMPNNSGWVSLGFVLKPSALSDRGVACVTCFTTAQMPVPGASAPGAEARTRIRAAGSPCGANLCVGQSPRLTLVPEPNALSLATLALAALPLLKRRARRG